MLRSTLRTHTYPVQIHVAVDLGGANIVVASRLVLGLQVHAVRRRRLGHGTKIGNVHPQLLNSLLEGKNLGLSGLNAGAGHAAMEGGALKNQNQ
jgi:hypothetical protein